MHFFDVTKVKMCSLILPFFWDANLYVLTLTYKDHICMYLFLAKFLGGWRGGKIIF